MSVLERARKHYQVRWWRFLWHTQGLDYLWLLPAMARLPHRLGFAAANLRGAFNAWLSRDWRSMSLGYRHTALQTANAYALLTPELSPKVISERVAARFVTESRCDFEAYLVNSNRTKGLVCDFDISTLGCYLLDEHSKGLVLLTPHFDSFWLGIVFLGHFLSNSGRMIQVMSSSVFEDPRVHPGISTHFLDKYLGIERFLNGGKMLHFEDGLRPYYQALERGDILIVLGDAPPIPNGVQMNVDFLGAHRTLAGGAVKIAKKQNSWIGAFVCTSTQMGRYQLDFSPISKINTQGAVSDAYDFLSAQIYASPEKWWAADLLPQMPVVAAL